MAKLNVERMLKHLFDGSDWNVYENSILNLGVGAPGTDLLQNCAPIFQKATEHRLQHDREHNQSLLFQYGPCNGTYEARHAIAQYLSAEYSDTVRTEDIYVTAGATQGLQLIVATVLDFNGYIFVDEVTYMIALDAFKQHSTLNIVPVRLTENGVDLAHLESLVKERKFQSQSKVFWGMYYTVPTYHNPTGIVFSEAVCRALIKLARQYDFLIACDDVYNLLHYKDEVTPKRLFAYDDRSDTDYQGNVISNGSFAKIIAPGLRLGWMEVPARVKVKFDSCGIINSGGCVNNYTAGIVASLFELGYAQTHIKTMYTAYKERMLATCSVLAENLPAGCQMLEPRGGYFIWLKLPSECDASDFLKYCLEHEHIFFIPGSRFAAEVGCANNAFRLSIAFHSKEKLADAAHRLCKALSEYLRK